MSNNTTETLEATRDIKGWILRGDTPVQVAQRCFDHDKGGVPFYTAAIGLSGGLSTKSFTFRCQVFREILRISRTEDTP